MIIYILLLIILISFTLFSFSGGYNEDEIFDVHIKKNSYNFTDNYTGEELIRPTYLNLYKNNKKIKALCNIYNYKIALLNLILPRLKNGIKNEDIYMAIENLPDDNIFLQKYIDGQFLSSEADYAYEFFDFYKNRIDKKINSILSIGIPVGRYLANHFGIKKYKNICPYKINFNLDEDYKITDQIKKNYDIIFISLLDQEDIINTIKKYYKKCKLIIIRTYIIHNFLDVSLAEISHLINFNHSYKPIGNTQLMNKKINKYAKFISSRYILNFHNGISEYNFLTNERIIGFRCA